MPEHKYYLNSRGKSLASLLIVIMLLYFMGMGSFMHSVSIHPPMPAGLYSSAGIAVFKILFMFLTIMMYLIAVACLFTLYALLYNPNVVLTEEAVTGIIFIIGARGGPSGSAGLIYRGKLYYNDISQKSIGTIFGIGYAVYSSRSRARKGLIVFTGMKNAQECIALIDQRAFIKAMTRHIAVLMGGWSAEREVSLVSGKACARALLELGYQVTEIDVKPDVAEVLARARPDVAFNALHGRFGEDGCMQGLLEMMKIPYTHSGVLASSVAMDKPMAKLVFASVGLRCPKGKVVTREELLKGDPLPRPFVVKPANEGSSVGVHIVTKEDNRTLEVIVDGEGWMVNGVNVSPTAIHQPPSTFLAEEYIEGREITVAVLNNKPLGVTEIKPKTGFYDYEHKYTDGVTDHLCPAPLPKDKYEEVMQLALRAHKALGCRGLTRSDFRYDGKHFYLLEINTQPGMTPLSLSPEIAAHAGIDFKELVKILVEDATLGES